MGNDEGLELDEADEDKELGKGNEKQVEEDEGEDVGGIQKCGVVRPTDCAAPSMLVLT